MIAKRNRQVVGSGAAGAAVVLAMAAASAATGAATNFTTMNSSQVTLLSFNFAPLTPSVTGTYGGAPTNNLPAWSSQVAMSTYGSSAWQVESLSATDDVLGTRFEVAGGGARFHLEVTWNVTFSRQVELRLTYLPGTLTYTPTGGSASTLGVGTQLAAGTYDIVWNFDETTPRSGATQGFFFELAANPVPGGGVAAAVSMGLAAIGRRRRR